MPSVKKIGNLESLRFDDADLGYFVGWNQFFWKPAVRWLIGDAHRFAGKRVLDLGCRDGRMSCLFGLLGADVLGVDLERVPLERARLEARHWEVSERVCFLNVDADPANIPQGDFDFIFTKSVLYQIPELEIFLSHLSGKLKQNGEMLLAENIRGGIFLKLLRRCIYQEDYESFARRFYGVDERFMGAVNKIFDSVELKRYYGVVAAIRASKKVTL